MRVSAHTHACTHPPHTHFIDTSLWGHWFSRGWGAPCGLRTRPSPQPLDLKADDGAEGAADELLELKKKFRPGQCLSNVLGAVRGLARAGGTPPPRPHRWVTVGGRGRRGQPWPPPRASFDGGRGQPPPPLRMSQRS